MSSLNAIELLRREWRVLQYLRKHPLCTLRQLADAQNWKEVTMAGIAIRRLKDLGLADCKPLEGTRKLLWQATALGIVCEVEVVYQKCSPERRAILRATLEAARARRHRRQLTQEQTDEDGPCLLPVRQTIRLASDAPPVQTWAPNSVWQLGAMLTAQAPTHDTRGARR